MRLRVFAASLAAAAVLVGAPVLAVDPPNFDFYGYADVPGVVLGTLTVRSVLTNNGVVPTPIALDFANNQYTLVVTGTLSSQVGNTQLYSGATIEIWEDPIAGGTAANYASAGTFTDGTLILSGVFDGNLSRTTFTPNLGSFLGLVDFTGGSRLGDLGTPFDWPFGGAWNRTISGIPAGYEEAWDGKIDLATVAVENETWDGLKKLYR